MPRQLVGINLSNGKRSCVGAPERNAERVRRHSCASSGCAEASVRAPRRCRSAQVNDPSTPSLFPSLEMPPSSASPGRTSTGAHEVAKAMALLWTYRPRTAIFTLLSLLGLKRGDGRAFTQDDVKRALAELRARGWLTEAPNREGYFRLQDDVRGRLYREVLDETPVATLRNALHRLDHYGSGQAGFHWPHFDTSAIVALVRLELFSGTSAKEIERLRILVQRSQDWNETVWIAALSSFDPVLFERIVPEWRWGLAFAAVTETCREWRADTMPVCEWAIGKLDTERQHVPEPLRLALAELFVHRGEPMRAQNALETVNSGAADALRACMLVQSGQWKEAQVAFEAAFKRRQVEVGARKRILPAGVAWLYPVALLAQQTPKHLELARKFCLGEAGKRKPEPARWMGPLRECDRCPPRRHSARSQGVRTANAVGASRPRCALGAAARRLARTRCARVEPCEAQRCRERIRRRASQGTAALPFRLAGDAGRRGRSDPARRRAGGRLLRVGPARALA